MSQKVLFTASTYSHVRNFHLPYLRAFQRLDWTVHVGCPDPPEEIPGAHRAIPLPFTKSMTAPQNLRCARQLRRLIQTEGYDLVISHTALAAFFTRLALLGLRHRPRMVTMVHGYLFDDDTPAAKRMLLLGAERLTAPVTDLLLTMNAWDTAAAHHHHLGREICVVPGIGVDFSHLPPLLSQREARARLSLPQDAFLLVYGAEFSHRKDQQTLLRALARLPEGVALLLPGSGSQWDACRQLAEQLGVAHRTFFPGQVSEMPLWYAAADAAVSASRSEGLPFNVMEAMHYGLPVAATAVKGHTDLIRDGESGLLFPFGDDAACAGQLMRLAEDGALRARLSRAGRADLAQYDLDVVLPQVMALYGAPVPATAQP